RSELGRLVFGALYGLSTVALYALLLRAGVPPFYDKLLQVPLLNLSVRALDRMAMSRAFRTIAPESVGRSLTSRQRHLAYISAWAFGVALMPAFQGVGDDHRGQWLPFWQRACQDDRPHACAYYEGLVAGFCDRESGWACNELGVIQSRRESEISDAVESTLHGCELGFAPACANADVLSANDRPRRALQATSPSLRDYPIVLRGSKGPIAAQTPEALTALACREGWTDACARMPQSQ